MNVKLDLDFKMILVSLSDLATIIKGLFGHRLDCIIRFIVSGLWLVRTS